MIVGKKMKLNQNQSKPSNSTLFKRNPRQLKLNAQVLKKHLEIMNKSYSESSQFFQNIPKKIDTAHRTPTVNKPYKGNKLETKRNSRNNFRSIKSKGSNRVIDNLKRKLENLRNSNNTSRYK